MKTTFDLPADLVRAIKLRAIEENLKLKDMAAELLRRGLAQTEPRRSVRRASRVELPLVRTAHAARPDGEMTPDRVAAVLLEEEASAISR
ncbi:MAG: antitoxin [Gemmatimonadales bacterium]